MFGLPFQLGNCSSLSSLSKDDSIRLSEMHLIQSPGPSLTIQAQLPQAQPLFQQEQCPEHEAAAIKVRTDPNSNIRLFYYGLLTVCFDGNRHGLQPTHTQAILNNFKVLAYSESLVLDRFPIEEIPEVFREFYVDRWLKKLLVEFLQLLPYHTEGVLYMLNRYPIVDLAMVLVVRALLGSTTLRYASIRTELLARYFSKVFGLQLDQQLNVQGTGLSLSEQPNYSYIYRSGSWQHPSITLSQAPPPFLPQTEDQPTDTQCHSYAKSFSNQQTRYLSCKNSLDPLEQYRTAKKPTEKQHSLHQPNDILIIPKRANLTEHCSVGQAEEDEDGVYPQTMRLTEEPMREQGLPVVMTSSMVKLTEEFSPKRRRRDCEEILKIPLTPTMGLNKSLLNTGELGNYRTYKKAEGESLKALLSPKHKRTPTVLQASKN